MQLLQHFKELTIRPKNAEELKGLILQLAIQGKLTANWRKENPDIESANILIKNILQDKERLIKLKKSKQKKHLSNVSEEEKPFNLPKSWVWCRLGDITDLPYGKGLSKKDLTVEGYYVFGANGIIGKYSSYLYEDEQLLISCRGAYSGKTNISPKKCFVTSNSLVCEFFNKDLTFYKYFFYSITALPKEKIVSGSAQPQVTATNALPLPIALPPLEEQKEIVRVVETLFKEVEQLEQLTVTRIGLKEDFVASVLNQLTTNSANQEWNFLQEHFKSFFNETTNIKKLRETVLQLAVQGKLTADWRANNPDTEDASQLLKLIQEEKVQLIKDKKIKKEKALPPITKEDIPYELPEGWVWCRFGDITTVKGGKRLPKGEKLIRENTGFIYLRVTDMKNGTVDESDLHYLTPNAQEIIKNYTISKNEIYLTIVGATIGKLGSIPDKFDGINLTENAVKINPYLNNRSCVEYLLNSKFIQNQFLDKTLQVGVPKLAMHRINKTLFPLPPLKEQKAIVEKATSLMELCDGLEQEVQQSQEHSEMMMQSVLKEVFEEK